MAEQSLPYDSKDKYDIERYGLALLNKCLRDKIGDALVNNKKDKGELGNLVQSLYFKVPVNNSPEPDFPEAGVELKVTPIKQNIRPEFHDIVTKRFFFTIFQKNENKELVLKNVMFWGMPAEDVELSRLYWEDTKAKIKANIYDDFYALKDERTFHVRPKGVKSKKTGELDKMPTPAGGEENKKAYWINASYIKKVINT